MKLSPRARGCIVAGAALFAAAAASPGAELATRSFARGELSGGRALGWPATRQQTKAADSTRRQTAEGEFISARLREKYFSSAQVHIDTAVGLKNVAVGPEEPGSFAFRQEVACDFEPDTTLGGNTPKFVCVDSTGAALKVKYGCGNGEVFGEVAASRLLWLLGFEADRMYPVRVKCNGCPPVPAASAEENSTGRFECAVVERKAGITLESFRDQGWSWYELDKVSASAGGAELAHVDALKLAAVLLQHNDSKESNQRMICPEDAWREGEDGAMHCARPRLLIHDVGATFGGAGNRVRPDSKVDLVRWREQRIWRDAGSCTANLAGATNGGTLSDPRISEAGRAFLSGLLMKVRASQIRELFDVSLVTLRDRGTTVPQWESAFWYKAYQIVNHRCPV